MEAAACISKSPTRGSRRPHRDPGHWAWHSGIRDCARRRDTVLGAADTQKCEDVTVLTPEAPKTGPALAERPSSVCLLQGQTCGCLIQTRKPETVSNFAKARSWEEVRPGCTPAFLCRALWGARG